MATEKPALNIYNNCSTEQDMLHKLEKLARNRCKIPLVNDEYQYEKMNINRSDAKNYLTQSASMAPEGKVSDTSNIMANVLKHDYLRRSMEQRVQRKALYSEFRTHQKKVLHNSTHRDTLASRLRSQSVLDTISSQKSTNGRKVPDSEYEFRQLRDRMHLLQKANSKLQYEAAQSDYESYGRKSSNQTIR